jgi:hypothetical protein
MSVIPQTPRASGGLSPPGPCLGPAGDLKRSSGPSPTHAPPNHKSWIRPWYRYEKVLRTLCIVLLKWNVSFLRKRKYSNHELWSIILFEFKNKFYSRHCAWYTVKLMLHISSIGFCSIVPKLGKLLHTKCISSNTRLLE